MVGHGPMGFLTMLGGWSQPLHCSSVNSTMFLSPPSIFYLSGLEVELWSQGDQDEVILTLQKQCRDRSNRFESHFRESTAKTSHRRELLDF